MGESKFYTALKKSSPARVIVISFISLVLLGTLLLMLPISSKSGVFTNPVDAYFTATSATCVTGLAVYDTYSYWSVFGQAVILLLIQCGGLGIATFATGFSLLLRRKLGIKELILARDSTGGSSLDIGTLLRIVLSFTFIVEIIGACLLMLRFVPQYGGQGVWVSVFISISAFCNAGFDILGFIPGNSSLSSFNGDPLVMLTICGLIIVGGTGFVIFNDIYVAKIRSRFRRERVQKLSFHTQVCLRATVFLLVIGTVLFLFMEYDNTLSGMGFFEKLNASFFQSVNTRTSGFASVPIAEESEGAKLLTVVLMFIGGCPGSTAGGIKVTTVVVLLAAVVSTMRGDEETIILRHRFNRARVSKAVTVVALGLFVVFVNIAVISMTHDNVSILDSMLEATSAFGTVGLSANLTPHLNVLSKICLAVTMFIGRVGPVSLGIAIMMRGKKAAGSILPEGQMLIG